MSMKKPPSDLITSQEVGSMLGLASCAVRNLSIKGVIPKPAVSIPSGKRTILRWSRAEMIDFVKKNEGTWSAKFGDANGKESTY
jgi:hypothetical protein